MILKKLLLDIAQKNGYYGDNLKKLEEELTNLEKGYEERFE